MRTATVRLDDLRTTVLNLGYVGENEHTQIRIDSKKMYDQYPTASASLTVCPPEGDSYPAVIERDGDFVLWTITDSDLIHEGSGEIQLSFTTGEVVAKTYIGRFKVSRSIVPTGEIPEGIDDFLTRAGAALTAIPETIDEALAEAKASGEFDGPAGPAGQDGADGQDGYSPTATVSKSGKVATITITDKNGTTTAQISDGEGGGTGDYADLTNKPQIAGVTLTGNVSLNDLGAAAESDIPVLTSLIDDTAGDGDTDKVWSADKSASLLSEKVNEPSSEGTAGQFLQTDGQGGRTWATPSGGGANIDDTAGIGAKDKAWSADKLTADFSKKTDAITKTKSGSYVDIADGASNTQLQSCVVTIDENEGQTGIKIKKLGKNLLKTVDNNRLNPSSTVSGVTFTVNSDGTVKARGTSTGNITFYLNDFYDAIFKNRRCFLTGTPLGGGPNTYCIKVYKYVGSGVGDEYGNGYYFTADERCLFAIYIKSGVAIDATFKPMVQYAGEDVSDTTYEPYTETEYTVSWGDEAGEITDGQFNAITGELTVTAPTAGTYQLDPIDIRTARGYNTFFSILTSTTNNASTGSVSIAYSVDEEGFIKEVNREEVSILFIGNSLTQDCVSYLPHVIKRLRPDLKFRFYIYYNASLTLAEQYTKINADTACDTFSVAENTDVWTNTNSSVKLSTVLANYQFDIVCMQEYFNNMSTYTTEDLAPWNNIQQYIVSNYKGGNGLKFVTLFHAPRRYSTETVMTAQRTGCALFLTDTVCEDMIPAGLAIYLGMQTALDSLGQAGHLSSDDTHAQEGIPCLIQTYSIFLWLLDVLGKRGKSIYGTPFRMDVNIYGGLNVPGPHIGNGFIPGTDEQNLLAQKVAIMAYKEGRKFVLDHLYAE